MTSARPEYLMVDYYVTIVINTHTFLHCYNCYYTYYNYVICIIIIWTFLYSTKNLIIYINIFNLILKF